MKIRATQQGGKKIEDGDRVRAVGDGDDVDSWRDAGIRDGDAKPIDRRGAVYRLSLRRNETPLSASVSR